MYFHTNFVLGSSDYDFLLIYSRSLWLKLKNRKQKETTPNTKRLKSYVDQNLKKNKTNPPFLQNCSKQTYKINYKLILTYLEEFHHGKKIKPEPALDIDSAV